MNETRKHCAHGLANYVVSSWKEHSGYGEEGPVGKITLYVGCCEIDGGWVLVVGDLVEGNITNLTILTDKVEPYSHLGHDLV